MVCGLLERKYLRGLAALTIWRNEWFVFNEASRILTVVKGKATQQALQRHQDQQEDEAQGEELEVIAVRDIPNRVHKRAHRFDFVLRSTWKVYAFAVGYVSLSHTLSFNE